MADPLPTEVHDPVNIDLVAKTIRTMESNSNYTAPPNAGGASGAYQFTGPTWQGLTARYGIGQLYHNASDAPADIQDQVAKRYIGDIILQNGGNVAAVPEVWYVGNIKTAQDMADTIPMPQAGNKLTVRQYVTKWLDAFHGIAGQSPGNASPLDPSAIGAGLGAAGSTIMDGVTSTLDAIKAVWSAITNPDNWKHIFSVVGGGILVIVGLYILASSFGMAPKGSTVVKSAVKGAVL